MNLIEITLNAKSLKEFVYGDGLLYVLYELDIRAATNAIKKSKSAKDKKAQLWSAINHLESAEEKIWNMLNSNMRRSFRRMDEENLFERRRYIMCLMALIYRVIGEKKLMNKMIEKAEVAYTDIFSESSNDLQKILFGLTVLYNPMTYYDGLKEIWSNKDTRMKQIDVYSFAANLRKIRI